MFGLNCLLIFIYSIVSTTVLLANKLKAKKKNGIVFHSSQSFLRPNYLIKN